MDATRQEKTTRKDVIGASVNAEEKARVHEASRVIGAKSVSQFAREAILERTERILTPRTEGRRRGDKAA
jgi:uncharacterized protein (DUF1778 family)